MNTDDNSRLGRGLESLIPARKPPSGQNSQPADATAAQPVHHSVPAIEPSRELPAPEIHAELPAEPVRPEPSAALHEEKKPAPVIIAEEKKPEPIVVPEERKPEPHVRPEEGRGIASPSTMHLGDDFIQPRSRREKHAQTPEAIFQIEIEKIKPNPDQPRRFFDEDALRDLASSIREFGLLQPLVVTKVEHEVPHGTEVEYILISGERRLMASKLLGLERVPAIIRSVAASQERLELAIIENIQRENLNAIEIARSMARLQDEFRLTQREIAARLGKSREVVANTVRLLDLPPYLQKAVEEGKISESHGRLLLAIEEPALQERLYKDLVERSMTTRELRQKIDAAKPKQGTIHRGRPALTELSPEMKMLQEKLTSQLGAPVAIRQEGESGKITITFYSEEELKNIAEKLSGEENF